MLRLRCSHPLGTGEARACLGEDDAGRRWGWFESDASRTEPTAIPSALNDADALCALVHLPGWRLSRLARLELGGRVVVAGDGWLARTTLTVCSLRGCAWRASAHDRDEPLPADYLIPRALSLLEALRRGVLPANPDAVILTSALPERLLQATQVCRARGTIVVSGTGWSAVDLGFYPEIHKRGLRVVLVDTWGAKIRGESDESSMLGLSQALVTAGVGLP